MTTKKRNLILLLLTVFALSFCIWTGQLFIHMWRVQLPDISPCVDRHGALFYPPPQGGSNSYYSCVEESAKFFLTTDYSEAKDASKAFLTLLTAILVASITFSEKIVDVSKSAWTVRGIMIATWVLLLLAIASCGAALALMMDAAGYATYFPQVNYRLLERKAVILYMFSGLAFGSALATLMIAGAISMATRRAD